VTTSALVAAGFGLLGGSPAISKAARAWLRGQAALQRGELAEAVQELRVAADLGLPPAWAWLALALAEEGAVAESVRAAERALALDSRTPEVTGPVSLALARGGKSGQAVDLAENTLRSDPSNQHAGMALLAGGSQALNRGLEIIATAQRRGGPPESEFLVELNRAALLEAAERPGDAADAFLRALRTAPGDLRAGGLATIALGSAARNRYRAGQLREARALAEQALTMEPAAARAHATLGLITIAEGGHVKAREHFRAALRGSQDRRAAAELAAALDREGARTRSPEFWFYAAWVLREAGDHGPARERFLALRDRSSNLPATLRDELNQIIGDGGVG